MSGGNWASSNVQAAFNVAVTEQVKHQLLYSQAGSYSMRGQSTVLVGLNEDFQSRMSLHLPGWATDSRVCQSNTQGSTVGPVP